MKIHFKNPIIKIVVLTIATVLFLGALLDAYSNAISIISPKVTYVCSLIVILGAIVVFILEKTEIITLVYEDESKFSATDKKSIAAILGVLIILWIPMITGAISTSSQDTVAQRGFLDVSELKVYEVFYPKPFSTVPNLTFSKMVNNQYSSVTFDITEQKKEGFKIKATSTSSTSNIEWIATGMMER